MSRRKTKSVAELRAAFDTNDHKGGESNNFGNYYPFWNMDFGQHAVIRFLPDKDEDNPLDFLVEKMVHPLEINGETKKIPCLKMYGDSCPICDVSKSYYDAGDEDNGKKYWRKKNYIAQALIIEDPLPVDDDGENCEGKVKAISMNWQLYNLIKEIFEAGELEMAPHDYEEGCNFIIKKTKQGKWATYSVASRFARKTTSLTDDEIEFVESELMDLATLLPSEPNHEEVESMLQASLNGEEYRDARDADESEDETEADGPPAPSKAKKSPSKAKAKVEEEETDDKDDEFDEEADEILQRLKNRHSK